MRLTRLERVKLLLKTYPDVCTQGRSELVGSSPAPASRPLRRHELWDEGSYYELEQCLETMRERAKSIHWHTCQAYMNPKPPTSVRKRKAELGVTFIRDRMTNIFVPLEVSLNAGYAPGEAKAAAKPRLYRAA